MVLKTPGWVAPSSLKRKSMISTSQPKPVNHCRPRCPRWRPLAEQLSVILAYHGLVLALEDDLAALDVEERLLSAAS